MLALDTIAKVTLSPLLIPQGIRIQKTALILEEPAGPREGCIGQGSDLRLLILGDSSAAGVGVGHQDDALSGQLSKALSQDFRVNWQLWAKNGETTRSMLAKLQDKPATQFDIAVSVLGVNDVTRGLSIRNWLMRQRAIFERLEDRHGVKAIFVTGLPPIDKFPLLPQPMRAILGAQAQRYDRTLKRMLAQDANRTHYTLDLPDDPALMAVDGFHPGPQVYVAWGAQLADLIRPVASALAKA